MIVFESEVYAENGKGCLPFKVIVEESHSKDKHSVEVRKIEFNSVGGKVFPKESLMFVTGWTEEQKPLMCAGSTGELGSEIMFDFGDAFLEIMNKGGETVATVCDDETESMVDESWLLKDDKYVCERKGLAYSLEEFVLYLNRDECDNIDVYLKDILKIRVSQI